MTLDEAYEEFSRLSDRWSNPQYLVGELSQEFDRLTYEMRRLAPVDTGRLKSSIALLAEATGKDLSVVLQMLDYGYYQNFGVLPTAKSPINRLASTPAERTQPYGIPPFTPFRYTNRQFGLPATNFIQFEELRDQVATIVEANLQNQVNDIAE